VLLSNAALPQTLLRPVCHVSCWFFLGIKEFFHSTLSVRHTLDRLQYETLLQQCYLSVIFTTTVHKFRKLQTCFTENLTFLTWSLAKEIYKWGVTFSETSVFDITSKDAHKIANMPVTSKIVHDSCVSSLSTRELWTGVANNVPPSPANPLRAKTGYNVSNAYPELTNQWNTHNIRRYRSCFGSRGPRFFHCLSFT
jgi:hypothetical protein